jgi:calreticulin
MKALALILVALICVAHAKVYFHEAFDTDAFANDRWVQSTSKSDYGKFVTTAGATPGDKQINQGLQTSQDARFYAASTSVGEPIENKGKDFVVSVSVKHEQGIDCGGGYIKLLPKMDPKTFNGDSEYFMMFGPDICGYTKKIHLIFNYNGKNLLWKKEPRCEDDKLTHVYTVVVKPDNTYQVLVDQQVKESGSLEDDWDFLPPKEIDDPSDKKPEDWVDEAEIDDPEDKKPEDWDTEPATIADENAKQPEDWDEAEDGKWEPPQVPNPKHKGEWRAKRIPNPAYKGVWKAKRIANPDYKADAELYSIRKPIQHAGIDIWQVKSGTIFDNIVIADNLDEVNAIIDKTWKATKDAEKKAAEEKDAAGKKDEKKDDEDEDKAAEDKSDESKDEGKEEL